eukprot:gene20749-27569_t
MRAASGALGSSTRPRPFLPRTKSSATSKPVRTAPQTLKSLPSADAPSPDQSFGMNRRLGMLSTFGSLLLPATAMAVPTVPLEGFSVDELENAAFRSYGDRDFISTIDFLDEIQKREPDMARWWEMRAQVLVDFKDFNTAIDNFNRALSLTSAEEEPITYARLLSGRALAYEGVSKWQDALDDYSTALDMATKGGESLDPYVINSIGNCYNSLGKWSEAREQYQKSSELFQLAKGFKARNGNNSARLDGSVFAASNAALMLVQLGDNDGAIKEMERIARRAPGSADIKAALAALYYDRSDAGDRERSEGMWNFACENIVFFINLWPEGSRLKSGASRSIKDGRVAHNRHIEVKQLFGPIYGAFCNRYAASVCKELKGYGLRYDDLYDPLKDEDVAEALRRLPPKVVQERDARLRRAIDLSTKHDQLTGDFTVTLSTASSPAPPTSPQSFPQFPILALFLANVQETLEEVRRERRERALLGAQPVWTRIYM